MQIAVVTKKHVKTVRRRKRRRVTSMPLNQSKMFKPMSSKLDVSALKIPCSELSLFASWTKPVDIDEKKHKDKSLIRVL